MNQIASTFLIQRAIALGVSGNSQGVLRSNTGMIGHASNRDFGRRGRTSWQYFCDWIVTRLLNNKGWNEKKRQL